MPLPYPMRLGRKPVAIAMMASIIATRMAAANISSFMAQSPRWLAPCANYAPRRHATCITAVWLAAWLSLRQAARIRLRWRCARCGIRKDRRGGDVEEDGAERPVGDRSWIGRRYTLLRPYAATTTPRPDRPSLPRDRVALRAARRATNIAGPGGERHPVAVQVRGSEKQLSAETLATGPPKPPCCSLHAMPAGGPPVTIYPLRRAARWEAKVLGLRPIRLRMRREKPPTWLGALWMLVCIGISLGTRRVARAFAYRR